jgi:hypothetical protein
MTMPWPAAFALLVLTTAFSRHAAAESCLGVDRILTSSLKPTVTVNQRMVAGKWRVVVDVHFANVGTSAVRLETWLAFQAPGIPLDAFRIRRSDGRPVRYAGPSHRRGPPRAGDFLDLPARAQRSVRGIDITDWYDFPATAQALVIKYQAASASGGRPSLVESEDVTLRYVP